MQKQSLQFVSMLILLAIVSAFNYNFFASLGITGVTLLNLLVVVTAAYFCEFFVALCTAFLAFLAINYFFTEPRYTFEVAHIESLTSLVCFLIVSTVITSLVKQLKYESQQSLFNSQRAEFARTLAERLALANNVDSLLLDTCKLLQHEFNKPFAIALPQPTSSTESKYSYTFDIKSDTIEAPDRRLLNWVSENGKPISPYTDYWTESITQSKQWLLPFNRLPSADPILVVDKVDDEGSIETYSAIKSCVDQISQAYQRLINSEKAQLAELATQEEAIQNALLASISHDMRTPLTSILGAATTLQQSNLNAEQTAQLTALITSQTRYLASTTENILSLIRLETHSTAPIPMDWQSPEELIGIVSELYKNRGETFNIKVNICEPELLIKGNANLLIQALVNLVDNAKQAQESVAHEVDEPIQIEVTKKDKFVNIFVKDRGKGFAQDMNIASIKKFTTSKAKGFGLGLSIVQAIAKSHGANFTIQNRVGGGACVGLSFISQASGLVDD
jgi:two-component system, OmpR family, sensor histidine kinase KdpD